MSLFKKTPSTINAVTADAKAAVKAEREALQLIEIGNAFEDRGQLNDALQHYDAAVRLAPEMGRAHFCRGNVQLELGNAAAAIEAYALALKYKPDSAAAHYNTGNAFIRIGSPTDAIAAYQRALALKPDFVDAEVALAAALEETGQFQEAAQHYQLALQIRPEYAEVHCNLGSVLENLGRVGEAVACYHRALQSRPDYITAHVRMGSALKELGRTEEAVASYRRILEMIPDDKETVFNLCDALHSLGKLEEAAECGQHAIDLQPDFAEAHLKLAIIQQERRQLDLAEASYRQALRLNPALAMAYSNLGVIQKERGLLGSAIENYRLALKINPSLAEAHINLGNALKAQGLFDDAAANFRRALEIKPDLDEAHYNLGVVLQELNQMEQAAGCYRSALQINPNFAEAWNNSGVVLNHLGRIDEALDCYRRALQIKPGYAAAHMNLGSILKDLGQLDEALASTRRALEIEPDNTQALSNLLFTQNYLCNQPPEIMLAEAEYFGETAARLARRYTEWPNVPEPGRCLRVGLVSGDLCNHPVGFFIESILAALSTGAAGRLELVAYPARERDDPTSRRLKTLCHAWHSAAGLSDEALSARIRGDGIDILIDLSGHTAHSRLPMFAWKPSPVQVSWLGYFATTGVREIDYFLADPWTLPPGEEANFTEKIWRMPETRLCFTPPDIPVEVGPLPAMENGYVTFCCFNNLSKVNDEVIGLWSRIVSSVPGSRLFLKYRQLNENTMRQEIVRRFAAHGIDRARLIMEGHDSRERYLAAYQRVDIGLDPFPFPGGTTTAEALWMGVPVLTLSGERFLSRQGVGLLMNAGLPEWVASDHADYFGRAVAHAANLKRLAELRGGLRNQVLSSPVFDAARFARHFEAALRDMWSLWCEQQRQAVH